MYGFLIIIPYSSHKNVTTVPDKIKGKGNVFVLFVRMTSPCKINIIHLLQVSKGENVPHRTTKSYKQGQMQYGSPSILNLALDGVEWLLYPKKNPLNSWLGGHQSHSQRFGD
jgi:hypothetical protein